MHAIRQIKKFRQMFSDCFFLVKMAVYNGPVVQLYKTKLVERRHYPQKSPITRQITLKKVILRHWPSQEHVVVK